MGAVLIADLAGVLQTSGAILKVAVGLGFVVFVHEQTFSKTETAITATHFIHQKENGSVILMLGARCHIVGVFG